MVAVAAGLLVLLPWGALRLGRAVGLPPRAQWAGVVAVLALTSASADMHWVLSGFHSQPTLYGSWPAMLAVVCGLFAAVWAARCAGALCCGCVVGLSVLLNATVVAGTVLVCAALLATSGAPWRGRPLGRHCDGGRVRGVRLVEGWCRSWRVGPAWCDGSFLSQTLGAPGGSGRKSCWLSWVSPLAGPRRAAMPPGDWPSRPRSGLAPRSSLTGPATCAPSVGWRPPYGLAVARSAPAAIQPFRLTWRVVGAAGLCLLAVVIDQHEIVALAGLLLLWRPGRMWVWAAALTWFSALLWAPYWFDPLWADVRNPQPSAAESGSVMEGITELSGDVAGMVYLAGCDWRNGWRTAATGGRIRPTTGLCRVQCASEFHAAHHWLKILRAERPT